MAWGNSLTAETIAEEATTSTANHASVPTIKFSFDATNVPPAIEHAEVTAQEAEEALAKFLETGNLYSVALHCRKSIEVIERLFANPEFKARLETAKSQLESLYVTFAEKTLHEIANNRYMSESARVKAASAILARHDKKQDIATLLERLDALEANKAEDDSELPPSLRGRR